MRLLELLCHPHSVPQMQLLPPRLCLAGLQLRGRPLCPVSVSGGRDGAPTARLGRCLRLWLGSRAWSSCSCWFAASWYQATGCVSHVSRWLLCWLVRSAAEASLSPGVRQARSLVRKAIFLELCAHLLPSDKNTGHSGFRAQPSLG